MMRYGLTKQGMIIDLNYVLCQFYGSGTCVSKKIERLPKAEIFKLHEVAWLNRDDPINEQVKVLEAWLANYN